MQKVSMNRSTSPASSPVAAVPIKSAGKCCCAGSRQTRWSVNRPNNGLGKSVADGHAIGDDIAFFIADRLNISNGEPAIVQFGLGLLQGAMQIVLQCWGAFRGSQYPGVDTVDFVFAVL